MPELDQEVAGEILGLDLAALLAPEPDHGGAWSALMMILRIRAADEGAAILRAT